MQSTDNAERGPSHGFVRRHKALATVVALTLTVPGVWALRLSELKQQLDRHRQYWSLPRGEAGGIVYVALGDSTAQGIGASRPERGYVGLVAQRLREATGRPVQVINLSVSGARVHDVVGDQIPKLAALDPEIVTVAVGANDVRDYEMGRFNADVDALVAALPASAVVGDVPWFMHGGTGRKSDEAAAYMAHVARGRGLRVAGVHDATQRRGWASMLTDFAADWFHPRDRGYRIWADAFWEAMISDPEHPALSRSPS